MRPATVGLHPRNAPPSQDNPRRATLTGRVATATSARMPRRAANQLRPISITPHFVAHPEGSALIECGDTRIICTATIDEGVPKWLAGKGKGWVTAEYDMLPRATTTRNQRDSHKGKIGGRTQEISRLIGRSLRAVVDLAALGERTVIVDC